MVLVVVVGATVVGAGVVGAGVVDDVDTGSTGKVVEVVDSTDVEVEDAKGPVVVVAAALEDTAGVAGSGAAVVVAAPSRAAVVPWSGEGDAVTWSWTVATALDAMSTDTAVAATQANTKPIRRLMAPLSPLQCGLGITHG